MFEGQPNQNKAEIPIKTRGPIWVLGRYSINMGQKTTFPPWPQDPQHSTIQSERHKEHE